MFDRQIYSGRPFLFESEGVMQMRAQENAGDPSAWDTFDAGQHINNPFWTSGDEPRQSKADFEEEEGFSVYDPAIRKRLEEQGYNPNDFSDAWSEAELEYKLGQAAKDRQARRVLEDAGGWGIVSGVAAGIMNPLVLATLPFGGVAAFGGQVGKAVMFEMVMAGGVEAITEGMLHAQQPERTNEESIMNVAASVLLSGLLVGAIGGIGKGVSAARKSAREIAEQAADHTADGVLKEARREAFVYPEGSRMGENILDDVSEIEWQRRMTSGERAPDGSFPRVHVNKAPARVLTRPAKADGVQGFFKSEDGAQRAAENLADKNPGINYVLQESGDGTWAVMQVLDHSTDVFRGREGNLIRNKTRAESETELKSLVERGMTACRIV